MKLVIEKIKTTLRGIFSEIAKLLDMLTGGLIRPWHVTLISTLGHVLVLMAIAEGLFVEGAILLAGFGLMDALDGALARYQKRASEKGMLLDAVSDRFKEVLVFTGFGFYFAKDGDDVGVIYASLALGFSFLVSYIKAKGEAAIADSRKKRTKNDLNREFEDGIFGYEVRMTILVVAMAFSEPFIGVILVTSGAAMTALTRYRSVIARINDQN